MTDKEQKKWHEEKWGENEEPEETPTERPHCDDDSIKNQDKEQIMINGVDVSGCEYLTYQLEEDGQYYWFCKISPTGGPDECEYNPECFYKRVLKQLARKTQECEELREALKEEIIYKRTYLKSLLDCKEECEALKSESFTREELISMQEKDIDRYREALEEIEEYIYNNTDFDINDSIQSKTAGYDILQIIKGV